MAVLPGLPGRHGRRRRLGVTDRGDADASAAGGQETGPPLLNGGRELSVIATQADGRATGVPDVVSVGVGVWTRAPTPGGALSAKNEKAQAVVAAFWEQGVAESDLQSGGDLTVSQYWESADRAGGAGQRVLCCDDSTAKGDCGGDSERVDRQLAPGTGIGEEMPGDPCDPCDPGAGGHDLCEPSSEQRVERLDGSVPAVQLDDHCGGIRTEARRRVAGCIDHDNRCHGVCRMRSPVDCERA